MIALTPRMARRATFAIALLFAIAPTVASAGHTRVHARGSSATQLVGANVTAIEPAPLSEADLSISRAHALHASVVRAEVSWSTLEPNGPNALAPRSLGFMDRLMNDAAAAGVRVIALVDSSPCWASAAPQALRAACEPGHASAANGWPPADPATYAAFVSYLTHRYGSTLAAVEVWNEPDHVNEKYFGGREKARHYAELLRAAYPAVKQANPSVAVLAGSLVGSNGIFLRALYAAGIKGYYDGLAVHYYNLTLASVRAIHAVQLANGDTKPLWLDEFGWTDCYPHERLQQEQPCVTERVQALNTTDVVRELARAPFVAATVMYKLQDSPHEGFGAYTVGGAQKRSASALARAITSPLGPVSPVRLSLRRSGGRVLASGSGPVGDFMRIEVFRGRTLRYWAVFTLDRFNRYSIKLPRALGTSGLRVRVLQYWTGRRRAATRRI